MKRKAKFAFLILPLTAVAFLPAATGQNSAPPSMEEQLKAQYTLSKVHSDGTLEPGRSSSFSYKGFKVRRRATWRWRPQFSRMVRCTAPVRVRHLEPPYFRP